MSKNIFTSREQLICGKLDKLYNYLSDNVEAYDLLSEIKHDAERMERKLIMRKQEVEVLYQKINNMEKEK